MKKNSDISTLTRTDYAAYSAESLRFCVDALRVRERIEDLRAAQAIVDALEARLQEEKARLRNLQEIVIPETLRMACAPLDRFPLGDSFEITPAGFTEGNEYLRVGSDLHVSIVSANQDGAERWLSEHGYGDKVTRKEVVSIHAQTLKKAVRDALEAKENSPELHQAFHIYPFEKAEIKSSRKTKSNNPDQSNNNSQSNQSENEE